MRKNKLSGLKELNTILKGITAELVDAANARLAVMIHSEAIDRHMPVNTFHMKKNTGIRPSAGAYTLFTNTHYAERQYFGNLLHLYDAVYRSIRRAAVPIDRSVIESTKQGFVGAETYAQKYNALKKAGLLTRRQARWFHRAAEAISKPDLQQMKLDFVRIARAKLKGKHISGKRYRLTTLKR